MKTKKLRFGTFLAPNIMPVYQAIADEVGRQLGIETELIVETDYESCAKDLNDVCFVCSLPYVIFERQGISPSIPIAAPVVKEKRYQNKPIYFSDVIVKKDASFKSFKDLKGHSWAYNEPLSHSGYGITRYTLVKMGETNGYFSKVVEAGFHEKSIQMVAKGEIDASAIDSQVLSVAMRDNPDLKNSLKIIDALGPSTIQPIAVSKRLKPALRKKILNILLNLHKKPEIRKKLAVGLVSHFVPATSKSYDDIRMMLEESEKANFLEIR
jgi:phosphonate transport system substrate-binding protein